MSRHKSVKDDLALLNKWWATTTRGAANPANALQRQEDGVIRVYALSAMRFMRERLRGNR